MVSYNRPDHSPENSTLSLAVLLMEVLEVLEVLEVMEVMEVMEVLELKVTMRCWRGHSSLCWASVG